MDRINDLRKQLDGINVEILELLNNRAAIAYEIGRIKSKLGLELFDPDRESKMLTELVSRNAGPMTNDVVKGLFKEVFKSALHMMEIDKREGLLVSRVTKSEDTVIDFGDVTIGGAEPAVIAGPCAVESREQIEGIARFLKEQGVRFLRGGVYKPRTSPYSFQGVGDDGLDMIRTAARENGLLVISEVVDTRHVEMLHDYVDVYQIGARNMQNFELLKLMGESDRPVLLKRGFMATIEEFLMAAEYIMSSGNDRIILCERGIRTFERWTRNTLDISAVPLLKNESHLPVIVDISHSTGRVDIAQPVARAAMAAGADGIMVEVHNAPQFALSDSDQQLDFSQFGALMDDLFGRKGGGSE